MGEGKGRAGERTDALEDAFLVIYGFFRSIDPDGEFPELIYFVY
jgi:hypothetical protein